MWDRSSEKQHSSVKTQAMVKWAQVFKPILSKIDTIYSKISCKSYLETLRYRLLSTLSLYIPHYNPFGEKKIILSLELRESPWEKA